MIDLDKIEEWNENGLGEEGYEVQAIVSKGDLLDIIARLRQAEKDAARYRWLRDDAVFTHDDAPLVLFTDHNGDQMVFNFDGSSYSVLDGDVLDTAVDEAMQCK